jgi:hypothetical protein
MSGIGIWCSHKRAKRNSGARSKDQGFTHISLPFISIFEGLLIGGNNHVSARGLFVLGRIWVHGTRNSICVLDFGRVNKTGTGDDDPTLLDEVAA